MKVGWTLQPIKYNNKKSLLHFWVSHNLGFGHLMFALVHFQHFFLEKNELPRLVSNHNTVVTVLNGTWFSFSFNSSDRKLIDYSLLNINFFILMSLFLQVDDVRTLVSHLKINDDDCLEAIIELTIILSERLFLELILINLFSFV